MISDLGSDNQFDAGDTGLFTQIADDLKMQGYSINLSALPLRLGRNLFDYLSEMNKKKFHPAGIGRDSKQIRNDSVRSDDICWITGESNGEREWLQWIAKMQIFINRRLFLGLFSFESHFSHYAIGDFYQRHVDAFKGETNRILSIVVYLSPNWNEGDGGELVLYESANDLEGLKINPVFGTVVVFLSEDFPHEVLVTTKNRYSIAGWFRVNSSAKEQVRPPL